MARTIVVIGGAGGGPAAAARAREVDEHARILLVEKKPKVSWVQAGLRHHLEGRVRRVHELETERAAFFHERYGIEVRTGTEAVRIDPESKRIVLGSEAVRFDAAIFSGGAEIVWPEVAGLERGDRVVGFRTGDDLDRILAAKKAGATKAVVLGAGPYGVDAADGLLAAGFDVDVVERNDRVLRSLSLLGALKAQRAMRARLHVKDEVTAARKQGAGFVLTTRGGRELEADLVVVATGLRPSTALLSEAGASLNGDGSVRTTPDMQTTLPDVYACGTAVSIVHAVTRAPLWSPQAAIAARTSQIAGRNAADPERKERLPPLAGSALYVVGEQRFARTGLSETDARAVLGDERVVVVTIHGYSGEPWVGGDELCVRLVVDRQKDAVVGGELWGREGVPRRADVLSAAIEAGWSPSRLSDLDMAYTATLGPAVDPLQIAARLAAQTLAGEARPISAESLALRVMKRAELQIVDVSVEQRPGWPEGTRFIPLERLRAELPALAKDKPTVLVSRTGQRAYQAYRILAQRGFTDVVHLDGGWLSYSLLAG